MITIRLVWHRLSSKNIFQHINIFINIYITLLYKQEKETLNVLLSFPHTIRPCPASENLEGGGGDYMQNGAIFCHFLNNCEASGRGVVVKEAGAIPDYFLELKRLLK